MTGVQVGTAVTVGSGLEIVGAAAAGPGDGIGDGVSVGVDDGWRADVGEGPSSTGAGGAVGRTGAALAVGTAPVGEGATVTAAGAGGGAPLDVVVGEAMGALGVATTTITGSGAAKAVGLPASGDGAPATFARGWRSGAFIKALRSSPGCAVTMPLSPGLTACPATNRPPPTEAPTYTTKMALSSTASSCLRLTRPA